MFEFLLLDLDDTIFDFKGQEKLALQQALRVFDIDPTDEVCDRYSQINREHWERLERKEITREQVLVGRYAVLLQELGLENDPVQMARTYEKCLSQGHLFLPGAVETLERLFGKYKLYIVSNGTSHVQAGRLKSADIGHFFEKIFISQDIGVNKPDKEFFERCIAKIPGFQKEKALIVGDSLSSDILGGRNAGIATCWVNARHKPADPQISADYEIESLAQLPELLQSL